MDLKVRLIKLVRLITEILSHALVAREHGIDDFLACIVELFVGEFD